MSSISLTAGDKSNVFSIVMLRFLAKVHRNNFAQHSIEDSKVFIISHYLHINFSQHRTTYWFLMIYFLKGRVNSVLKQSEREQHGHEAEKSCFEGETPEGTQ